MILIEKNNAYVASSLASLGGDADNAGPDNAVDGIALLVGDDGQVGDHTEHCRDAAGRVAGLAPTGSGHQLAGIGGVALGGQAGRPDPVVEVDLLGQLDEGHIVGQRAGVPVLVRESLVGGDLNAVGLAGGADVVRPGHDVKVGGALDAVGGGENVGVGDEGAAAEPGVVDEEGDLPGPLVLGRFDAADDPVLVGGGGRTLDTALADEVLDGARVGLPALHLMGGPAEKASRMKFLLIPMDVFFKIMLKTFQKQLELLLIFAKHFGPYFS
jgi:hypothetical protein